MGSWNMSHPVPTMDYRGEILDEIMESKPYKHSPEVLKKIGDAARNPSPETRKKMSEARKLEWRSGLRNTHTHTKETKKILSK